MNEPEPQAVEQTVAPAPPPEKYPFWTYEDVVLVGALAVPLLVFTSILVAGVFALLQWRPSQKALQVLPAQFLFYLLWFLFLYVWIKLRYDRPFWRSLAWIVPRQGLWSSSTWGILTALAVIALGTLLRPPEIDMPLMDLLRDRVSLILVGAVAVTLGPLCEELAFRGFLLPLLIRSLSALPGILITALLFASLHGPEYAWSWRHLLLITLAGVAFGWMRYRSGSTATATVMHAAYNLTFFVGMVAQRVPQ
jgi:membrane protease YdiL (CAAX protease family)